MQNPLVIDVVTNNGNHIIHKQIERKNGQMFIRVKKRRIGFEN